MCEGYEAFWASSDARSENTFSKALSSLADLRLRLLSQTPANRKKNNVMLILRVTATVIRVIGCCDRCLASSLVKKDD